jgi:hypothetical protein
MARGRKTSLDLSLTLEQRLTLESWLRSTTVSAGLVKRARIILAVADKTPVSDIARSIPISRRLVYKWVERFRAKGPVGLQDAPRSGRPPVFSPGGGGARGQDGLRAA